MTAVEQEWIVEMWVDAAWYSVQDSPDPMPVPGPPLQLRLQAGPHLIGRVSQSRQIFPDIDCGFDSGVSRRQAQLTNDDGRWFVEDLDSANGTFVAGATEQLPTDPIPVGEKHELAADDQIYLGGWTRLTIRPAAAGEPAEC